MWCGDKKITDAASRCFIYNRQHCAPLHCVHIFFFSHSSFRMVLRLICMTIISLERRFILHEVIVSAAAAVILIDCPFNLCEIANEVYVFSKLITNLSLLSPSICCCCCC